MPQKEFQFEQITTNVSTNNITTIWPLWYFCYKINCGGVEFHFILGVIHNCQPFSKVYKEYTFWKPPPPLQKVYINHFESLSRQKYNHSKMNRKGIYGRRKRVYRKTVLWTIMDDPLIGYAYRQVVVILFVAIVICSNWNFFGKIMFWY